MAQASEASPCPSPFRSNNLHVSAPGIPNQKSGSSIKSGLPVFGMPLAVAPLRDRAAMKAIPKKANQRDPANMRLCLWGPPAIFRVLALSGTPSPLFGLHLEIELRPCHLAPAFWISQHVLHWRSLIEPHCAIDSTSSPTYRIGKEFS